VYPECRDAVQVDVESGIEPTGLYLLPQIQGTCKNFLYHRIKNARWHTPAVPLRSVDRPRIPPNQLAPELPLQGHLSEANAVVRTEKTDDLCNLQA
jgi:hypothetical protein